MAERNRLVDELRQLRESLALLPSERSPMLGASTRQDALLRLRRLLARLSTLQLVIERHPEAAIIVDNDDELSMLAALRRMNGPLVRELEQARTRGLGDRHPRILSLVAQIDFVTRRVAVQLETERQEGARLEAALATGHPSSHRNSAIVVLGILHDRFASPDFTLANVASFDPISLRLLALESARLELEAVMLAQAYGPMHPLMVRLASRGIELSSRFRDETRLVMSGLFLAALDAARADPQKTVRWLLSGRDVREGRARALADEIALLSIRIAERQATEASTRSSASEPCLAWRPVPSGP